MNITYFLLWDTLCFKPQMRFKCNIKLAECLLEDLTNHLLTTFSSYHYEQPVPELQAMQTIWFGSALWPQKHLCKHLMSLWQDLH